MAFSNLLKSIFCFTITLASCITVSKAGNFAQDLKPLLSFSAEIYYPGSEGYRNATERWSSYTNPILDVVVKVTCEEDVQETVCLSFLTIFPPSLPPNRIHRLIVN